MCAVVDIELTLVKVIKAMIRTLNLLDCHGRRTGMSLCCLYYNSALVMLMLLIS